MLNEQQTNDEWARAASSPAKSTSWGFFSYLDIGPGLCGAGMGGFTWFDLAKELFDIFIRVLPASTRMALDKKQAASSYIQTVICSQHQLDAFALDAVREYRPRNKPRRFGSFPCSTGRGRIETYVFTNGAR
jgi:hypothetical protein